MSKSHAMWNRKRRGLSITRLLARDGTTCWLCGGPLDRREPEPHRNPHAITFDHVVPRSHGGTSDLQNLRLAHRACNLARGNDPLLDEESALRSTQP